MSEIPVHPVQTHYRYPHEQAYAPQTVTLAAYEVYSHIHAPQESLITGECRGGFSVQELIAFLYARSFPRQEWEARVNQAFEGMRNL